MSSKKTHSFDFPDNEKSINVWERFNLVWILIGFMFLACAGALVASRGHQPGRVWLAFGVFSAWYLGLSYLEWRGSRGRWLLMFSYFTLGMAIWAVLGVLNPAFFCLLAILFPAVFRLLPVVQASVLAFLLSLLWPTIAWQFHGMPWLRAYALGIGFHLAGWTLGVFIHSIIFQSNARQALLNRLKKTQAELAEAERRSGRQEERRRIANEFHDTIAQCFTSVVIHLEAAEAVLSGAGEPLRAHLAAAKGAARDGLGQTRRSVWALRPNPDQNLALDAALRELAESWSAGKKIAVDFQVTGKPRRLPNQDRDLVLRCAKEGLQNVYKHAKASRAAMTLSYMENQVALDLVDDGIGMDGGHTQNGYGLEAMRFSVEARQGALSLESEPGVGVSLAVILPLEDVREGVESGEGP